VFEVEARVLQGANGAADTITNLAVDRISRYGENLATCGHYPENRNMEVTSRAHANCSLSSALAGRRD
jgi:hypothetical protein